MGRYTSIKRFEGLNALRFFAAFLVVMHHSETIKAKTGIYNLKWLSLFDNGSIAVSFFFVLSGFLITYLLLREGRDTGTVNVGNFYLKRVFRIWPLYYLLVIIGTIVLPIVFHVLHIQYVMPYTLGQTWFYFVFFLPGLVTFFFGHHFLEFIWSIGVEELFYLAWPLFFKYIREHILTVLLCVFLGKVALMTIAYFFADPNGLFSFLVNLLSFESMAIGGLGAYFIFNRSKPVTDMLIFSRPAQVIIYGFLFLLLIARDNLSVTHQLMQIPVFSNVLFDFLFLYLILGVSLVENSFIKLRNKTLFFFGEISYGMYMYHMLVVFAVIQFCKKFLIKLNPVTSQLVYYCIVFTGVVLISAISKKYFENYFMRLKNRVIKHPTPRDIAVQKLEAQEEAKA